MNTRLGLSTNFKEYKKFKGKDFIFLSCQLLYCVVVIFISIIGLVKHIDTVVLGGMILLLLMLQTDSSSRIKDLENKLIKDK